MHRREATLDDVFLTLTKAGTAASPRRWPHDLDRPRRRADPRPRLRWRLSDSLLLARRNLAHVREIPEKLIDVTFQPLMFVLLFGYVFGGVIAVPNGAYHEYLVGGSWSRPAFGMMGPASRSRPTSRGHRLWFRTLPICASRSCSAT